MFPQFLNVKIDQKTLKIPIPFGIESGKVVINYNGKQITKQFSEDNLN
jgi:hypothetical protein